MLQTRANFTQYTLPKIDGLTLLGRMQSGELPDAVPVILTRQNDPDLAVWAMELGAVDVLVKPIEARVIAQRLHRLDAERAA